MLPCIFVTENYKKCLEKRQQYIDNPEKFEAVESSEAETEKRRKKYVSQEMTLCRAYLRDCDYVQAIVLSLFRLSFIVTSGAWIVYKLVKCLRRRKNPLQKTQMRKTSAVKRGRRMVQVMRRHCRNSLPQVQVIRHYSIDSSTVEGIKCEGISKALQIEGILKALRMKALRRHNTLKAFHKVYAIFMILPEKSNSPNVDVSTATTVIRAACRGQTAAAAADVDKHLRQVQSGIYIKIWFVEGITCEGISKALQIEGILKALRMKALRRHYTLKALRRHYTLKALLVKAFRRHYIFMA